MTEYRGAISFIESGANDAGSDVFFGLFAGSANVQTQCFAWAELAGAVKEGAFAAEVAGYTYSVSAVGAIDTDHSVDARAITEATLVGGMGLFVFSHFLLGTLSLDVVLYKRGDGYNQLLLGPSLAECGQT